MSSHDVWYLTRASGLVAFGLAWFSVVLGLFASLKLTRAWPGPALAIDMHEHASLLAIGFSALHALAQVGDPEHGSSAVGALFPLLAPGHSAALEVGKLAFWLLVLVTLSFYLRKRIGGRAWRVLHYSSFLVYALALLHALFSGTDSASPVGAAFYVGTTLLVLGLTALRLRRVAPAT
jgi:predicted ferric reductase